MMVNQTKVYKNVKHRSNYFQPVKLQNFQQTFANLIVSRITFYFSTVKNVEQWRRYREEEGGGSAHQGVSTVCLGKSRGRENKFLHLIQYEPNI